MKNARANSSEIAEKVKLSTSTVIERIKKLENSGVIKGYAAIIVPEKLGKASQSIIRSSTTVSSPRSRTTATLRNVCISRGNSITF